MTQKVHVIDARFPPNQGGTVRTTGCRRMNVEKPQQKYQMGLLGNKGILIIMTVTDGGINLTRGSTKIT